MAKLSRLPLALLYRLYAMPMRSLNWDFRWESQSAAQQGSPEILERVKRALRRRPEGTPGQLDQERETSVSLGLMAQAAAAGAGQQSGRHPDPLGAGAL